MSELIEINQDDAIAKVALNRPEAYNAFNYEMISRLADCLTTLASDNNIKAVVITGNGRAFCAGGDLKWALEYSNRPAGAFHTPRWASVRAITPATAPQGTKVSN